MNHRFFISYLSVYKNIWILKSISIFIIRMYYNCIENIYKYLKISDTIATSWQSDKEDLFMFKRAGY